MTDSVNIELAAHQVLRVQTLGTFRVWYKNEEIDPSAWSREKSLHLFQFLITVRDRYLHKEQIIDRLWPEKEVQEGDRDFKVVLHSLNKVLEPNRKPRAKPRFIRRHELTYGLNLEEVWIDADAFEQLLGAGNQALPGDRQTATTRFQEALQLYHGDYLPERRFEDWASAERERLQVLALGLMTTLADLLVEDSPLESIRLAQQVLIIDPLWENAYRTQMQAYLVQGNRPMAIRVYQQCTDILDQELGIPPLPETDALFHHILNQSG